MRRPAPRGSGSLRRVGVVVAVVSAAVVAFAGTGGAAPVTGYVALGDSYTAGPLIPRQQPNPIGCLRSDHDYPRLTALALGLQLTDVSCSGAETGDMFAPQSVPFGGTNAPQLNAIVPTTKVVSVGIGGNDIGFISVAENCAAITPYGPTRVGPNCRDYYTAGGTDQLAAALAATGPKVGAVLDAIRQRASAKVKIFVVGYPALMPTIGNGCWPTMPFVISDLPYLRGVEAGLNAMLQTQAKAHGATYVNTFTKSLPHNACTPPATRWVEPVIPATAAAPVHPNAKGEAAVAGIVTGAMKAAGIG